VKILKIDSLNQIIKKALNQDAFSKLVYKIQINTIDINDNYENIGIFVHYFQDFNEIGSPKDEVFEKISKALIEQIDQFMNTEAQQSTCCIS
jgi:hypothetical protein